MTISVIVATRDRAALLEKTLEALSTQTPPGCRFEILVVDNASVDNTAQIVADVRRRFAAPLVYLTETKPGKSEALNSAIRHARGDLLLFTDDDVLPSADWMAAYAHAFEEARVDYAAGRILPLWEASPPWWLTPPMYGVVSIGDGGTCRRPLTGISDAVMPIGTNMAVRRHVIETVGGWNPDLGKLQNTLRTGEDHEFALKLIAGGFVGVYVPEAAVRHRVPADRLRVSYFVRWSYRNGAIEAGLEQEYPSTPRYLIGVPRYLWRRTIGDLVGVVSALLRANGRRAATSVMNLVWFAGYLRGSWLARRRAQAADVGRALSSGSSPC